MDGVQIIGSPHSLFEVKPTSLDATSCVPVDIPELMYAGYDYYFLIQSRDAYDNNLIDLFATAVGSDYSIVYTLDDDNSVTVEAQI